MKQITEQVNEKEIPIKVKNFLKEAFGDNLDKIDWKGEIDSSLNSDEIISHFSNFNSMFCESYKEKLKLKDVKEKAQAQKDLELSNIRKEEKELIESWKKSDFEDIDIKSFDVPKHFIKMVCKGISYGCVLEGEGGLGKTYSAINIIKSEKIDFEYQNTHSSPLELYKWLYWNKEKICILDDLAGIWNNPNTLAILKAVLWDTDGKRIATMNTSDRYLDGVPRAFEFKGGIILLSNKINQKDEHISALLSRCLYYELNFTYKEKLRIMKEITKKPYKKTTSELREKALNLLINNTDVTTSDLNFRTLIKTFDLLLYSEKNAEMLLKSTLKTDETKKIIIELMKKDNLTEAQKIVEFIEKTGKSRATYFRIKKELKELMK